MTYIQVETQAVVHTNERAHVALGILRRLTDKWQEVQKAIESLNPILEHTTQELNELKKKYEDKAATINMQLTMLMNEENEYEEAELRLRADLQSAEEELSGMKTKLSTAKSELDLISNEAQQQLQALAANSPPKQFKKLISGICILLEMNPSFKECGQPVVQSGTFMEVIRTIDYEKVKRETNAKLSELFDAFNFNPDEIQAISPWARLLFNFIAIIRQNYVNQVRFESMAEALQTKQAEKAEFDQEANITRQSMDALKKTWPIEQQQIAMVEQNHSDLDDQMNSLREKESRFSSLVDGLDGFATHLDALANGLETEQSMLTGNILLLSTYLVYTGSMSSDDAAHRLEVVQGKLIENEINVTKENPSVFCSSKIAMMDTTAKTTALARHLSHATENEVRRIQAVLRTPLIIDPEGYTIQHLITRTNPHYLTQCSFSDSDFTETLSNAMTEGKSLIVYDVNELTPLLESILPIDLLPADPAILNSVKIEDAVIQRDARFKLYLVTSLRTVNDIPEDLKVRVNLTICTLKSTISMTLYDIFRRQFCPNCKSQPSGRPDIELEMKQKEIEFDLLEVIADLGDEDPLASDDVTLDLLAIKERYLEIVAAQASDHELPEEYTRFVAAITFAQIFWEFLSRMLPRIGCRLQFSIRAYILAVENAINQLDTNCDPIEIDKAVRKTALEFTLPSLTWRESYFLLFVCSLHLKKGDLADQTPQISQSLKC
jgi:hypothetical protein